MGRRRLLTTRRWRWKTRRKRLLTTKRTRSMAASLRTLAGMLNTLADTLAQVEVVDNKEVEVEDKEEKAFDDKEVMAEYLGYDATIAFQGVGHSKAASRMLQSNLIGILPQEDRLNFT